MRVDIEAMDYEILRASGRMCIGLAFISGITFVLPVKAVTIDMVTVGNPGNANDPTTGFGAVGYEYKIATNETTIGQYSEFLNAVAKSDPYGIYNQKMASDAAIAGILRSGSSGSYSYAPVAGSANKPITYVIWFDAARFCNWLHNGQGNGSTETGAYTLNGAMSGIVHKNADAKFWIPTEDEWYKAAYYDPTKNGTGGYWLYPMRSDELAGNTIGVPNSANYKDVDYASSPGRLTDVGVYGANSRSFYGTNDQGGNVWEWNDAVMADLSRGFRGGAWGSNVGLISSYRPSGPKTEAPFAGFRVASSLESIQVDFRIISVSITAGGSQLRLSWTSESSATYSIESSPDLTVSSWIVEASGILSQGNSTTHTLDITPGPRRFFRVAKQP